MGPPSPAALAEVGEARVLFPKSSDYLRSAEVAKIKGMAEALLALPGETLLLHGMTDPFGDPGFNAKLRDGRSDAVHAKLLELGADPERVQIGEPREPDPGVDQPRSAMRRVEFSLAGLSLAAAPAGRAAGGIAVGPPHPAALAVLRDTQVFFPKSSDYLRAGEISKVEALAEAMVRLPGEVLLIRGMTDPFGDPKFNDWLRGQRSEAVRDKLVELGVAPARLAIGAPAAGALDGEAPKDRGALRRVEFGVVGARLNLALPDGAEIDQLAAPAGPPRFAPIGRGDRKAMADIIAVADATQIYFEFTGFRVKTEYHRELWNLAGEVLVSDVGALSIRAYASPKLEPEERGRLANRRCLAAAAMLQQMGVEWRRIRIEDEVGETEPGPPSWRDHRVEFTAIKFLAPGTEEGLGKGGDELDNNPVALDPSIAQSDDPLAALAGDVVVYFGGNSADVRSNDRKSLRQVARLMLEGGETRSLEVLAVTDRFGNADYNRALGRRRQQAVIEVLVAAGVPPERVAEGEIQDTDPNEGGPSWKQRRAELLLR